MIHLQPETQAYYNRIQSNRGDIHLSTLLLVDELIQTAKAQGWWRFVVEAYLFCGTNLNAALCKLVTPPACPDKLVNHGFTSEHFSERGGFGIVSGNAGYGDGKWLETGFTPSQHGLGWDNFCLIAGSASESVTGAISSGQIIGDLKPANADGCGISYRHYEGGLYLTVPAFIWQTTARNAKVAGLSCGVNTINVSADGIALEHWATTGAGTGGLTGEIGLWKCFSNGSLRNQNGVLGSVLFCSYIPPQLTKLATAAVSRFERNIRAVYGERKVLFAGDSIGAHQGATIHNLNGYTARVARKLGVWEWNMGSLSACLTTTTGQISALEMLPDILASEAQTVVMMFGTNDWLISATAAAYGAALETIAAAITGANKRLVICSPCYATFCSTTIQRDYAAQCEAVAAAHGCVYADTNLAIASQTTPGDFMADSAHPNDAGHGLMAECIGEAMGV